MSDAFPNYDDPEPVSGAHASPPNPGAPKGRGPGCNAADGPPEIEAILRGLDRFFLNECFRRLEPREKEGNPK